MSPRVDAIRKAFPALRRQHNGHPVAYFDGPGGTQVPQIVVDRMGDYLLHHNANTHWVYPTSIETDDALLAARRATALFLNCDPAEVAFGANMTTMTFHLARGIGRALDSGHNIVITELDHHANVAPWQAIARDRGIELRVARMIPHTGLLDIDHLASLIDGHTGLVAVGAASNALGTVNPVRTIADLAHQNGALVFVDAVHYAPHFLPDVRDLDCDFLACSAYKFYGPHVGILYGRRTTLSSVDIPKLEPAPDDVPERVETGTLNHEGIIGTHAAIDFLASIGAEAGQATSRASLEASFAFLHSEATALTGRLWKGLRELDSVSVFGPSPDLQRTPTVACTVHGLTSDEVCRQLADEGIFASNGDFYAQTVVERLGVEGLVRIGCACYTTGEEVDRVVDGVRRLANGRR